VEEAEEIATTGETEAGDEVRLRRGDGMAGVGEVRGKVVCSLNSWIYSPLTVFKILSTP
jgi:hypothetical protein